MAPVKHRWRSLFTIAFGNMIDTADGGLVNVLFPVIRSALHLDLLALGVLTAISRVARMVFGPLWAMAGDRWSRKKLLFVVTGVWGVWTGLVGLAQDQTQLYILYAIAAIGIVAAEPLATSITSDLFPQEERGRAFGALRGLGGLGFVAFAPLFGMFANIPDGWRWALFGMGGLSILSGVLVLLFLVEPKRGAADNHEVERIGKGDWKHLWTRPSIWYLAASMVCVTSLVLLSYAVTFLVDVRDFSNSEATYVLAVFGIGFVGSSFLGGWLGDWAHRKSPFKGRIVLMQVYLVAYALFSFLCLQVEWPHWAYYPLFLGFGLLSSIGFPGAVLPLVSAVVPAQTRSTAFGFLLSFVQGGSTAVLALLVGWLADRHGLLVVVFWLTTVPYLLNAVLWFVFYRTIPRDIERTQREAAEAETASELAEPVPKG